ncbi:MAG: hypothetical protein ACE5OQ_06695 [Woeseia sp.]
MNDKAYLLVTGILFGLIAIGQLARLLFQIPVQVAPVNVPMWPSLIAVALALFLCIWAIRLVRAGSSQH